MTTGENVFSEFNRGRDHPHDPPQLPCAEPSTVRARHCAWPHHHETGAEAQPVTTDQVRPTQAEDYGFWIKLPRGSA